MGRRGPAPLPTAIKLLRGERRPSRLNLDEPKVAAGLPERPAGMVDGADAVWDSLLGALGDTGAITLADAMVLRAACEAVAISSQIAATYIATGAKPVIRNSHGEITDNPVLRGLQRAQEGARIALREVGATPASRQAVRVGRSPLGDPLDAFLRTIPKGRTR